MTKRTSKKKKKHSNILKILLIIIFIIILYILVYKKDILEYKNKIIIEVGQQIPTINDYVYGKKELNEEIIWDNLKIKEGTTYKPGTYTGKFTFKKEEKIIILEVQDTTPPEILGTKKLEMLAYEKEPNLLKGVSATDNSKEKIEVTIEGEYNTEVAGEYTLTYKAVDKSGNESTKTITLTVKENPNVKISKTSKGNTIKNYYGITYIDNVVVVNKTYSLPKNFAPNNLKKVNGYIEVVDYVKKAFNELKSDASSIGLNIYASSGYRSYSNQKYIYNNYVKLDGKKEADTYSARAGHSEHQTGLAIDLNTINSSFEKTDESKWLKENCYKYGFIIRYPKGKEKITGYTYEPWHIRYVGKDLAKKLYNKGKWITIEEYFGINSKYE